ncbi:beta-phosphoglucomutase family hydrolase [Vibrio vulnificus]|uniref:beta-phosphoglucomutase family hydrolase n=1 Tax=Vibrio vulnificus TaxID=672 RepID=UPI0019D4CAAE|nr:beta-phosphoglucomutase family hydrolase [Vibrio vulnificus]MBN8091934.1 beta-phosphoglucomutase family hydrolase [Vibrio vulnificus]HAS6055004.1 beta-phosphoglucomutase family hydrolase [Vibrio vulnificus]HAS8442053.1 beta-phosphoglucomutase family hydrolase [Vibrio vulnificus]HDY7893533.1 beta-phosphoglucomutase family hydrolase [Vibrio vulnificus]
MSEIPFNGYTGFIFDMDGTLIDTMPAHLIAWEKTAEHFQFPFEQQWIHSLGGMPSFKIAAEINKKYGLSLVAMDVSQFKMAAFSALEEYGDAIECTHRVLEKYLGQKKMAVGTGSQRESAIRLLAKANLLDKLDALVSATEVQNHKPHPDTFLLAAQQLGLPAHECVVFEDTELGKQAAHAAKMDCVMVENGELVFYPVN